MTKECKCHPFFRKIGWDGKSQVATCSCGGTVQMESVSAEGTDVTTLKHNGLVFANGLYGWPTVRTH